MLVWPGVNCSHTQKRFRTFATKVHTILTRIQAMLPQILQVSVKCCSRTPVGTAVSKVKIPPLWKTSQE